MENIKDFILNPAMLDAQPDEPAPKAVKKPTVEFSTVFASGPDFAVRRKTARTSSVAVFFVSQSQFYIKNETDGGTVTVMNEDVLASFTRGIPEAGFKIVDDKGNHPSWIAHLYSGKNWAETIMRVLRKQELNELLKRGMLNVDVLRNVQNIYCRIEEYDLNALVQVFDICAKIDKNAADALTNIVFDIYSRYDEKAKRLLHAVAQKTCVHPKTMEVCCRRDSSVETTCLYDWIDSKWGIEGVRLFINAYYDTPVTDFPEYRTIWQLTRRKNKLDANDKNFPETCFNLQHLVEYMFAGCTEQGNANRPGGFWSSWYDFLDLQYTLYGEIKNKYPEHLLSDEQILIYKFETIQKQVDETKWRAAVAKMEPLQRRIGCYDIICPKEQGDLVEEGRQLSHCVGSYASSVAEGQCMIFFLRHTDTPEKSLVTIQLYPDGSLGQVRARFNRDPKPEQVDAVNKWHMEVLKTLGTSVA